MSLVFDKSVFKLEIYHTNYNPFKKHNLDKLPENPAVFGVFGVIHGNPVHPRFVGITDNLRKEICRLFEQPETQGLQKFMQGPWIHMICYDLLSMSREAMIGKCKVWIERYNPQVTNDGEYPEYCYHWSPQFDVS